MAGVNILIDSANIFVEHFVYLTATGSVGSALTVNASATGTYNGTDIVTQTHKGGKFFINFTTIGATCTVRFNLQSKDPLSGLYVTVASISLDGITTGNINSLFSMHVYPGIASSNANSTAEWNFSETFTKTMRLQASITATASVGGAACTIGVGLNKVV